MVAELNEDRREESTGILSSDVLESKKGGQHREKRSISWIIVELVVVDDRRNGGRSQSYRMTYVGTLLPESATKSEVGDCTKDAQGEGTYAFHGSTITNRNP